MVADFVAVIALLLNATGHRPQRHGAHVQPKVKQDGELPRRVPTHPQCRRLGAALEEVELLDERIRDLGSKLLELGSAQEEFRGAFMPHFTTWAFDEGTETQAPEPGSFRASDEVIGKVESVLDNISRRKEGGSCVRYNIYVLERLGDRILDCGTRVCLSDGTFLGHIVSIFGSVNAPRYVVQDTAELQQLPDGEETDTTDLPKITPRAAEGTAVHRVTGLRTRPCWMPARAPGDSSLYAYHVKGCDASTFFDDELPPATERPEPLIGGLEGPSDEVPAAQFGGPPPQGQHPGPPPKRRHISPAPRLGAAPPTAAVAAAPQPVPPPVLPPVLQQPAAMAEQPAADKVKAQQLGPAQQGCKPHAAAAVPDNICKCTSRRCSVSVTVERLLLAIVFTMSFYAGEQYQSSRQLAAQRTEAAGRSAVQSAELQERLALTPPAPPHRRALIRSRVHSLVQVLVVSVLGALLACGYSELRYGCWFSPRC
eukprot:TRINITY_DN1901_c0_g2_i2.p1 TRINITY_DN1901_c0_g2~~TRINITY_DN1901_c0_g2_i2.p1  ORF type:complete len:483 (+),score=138.00 TRINITY_DN1901_c0_g2_i2:85-1533(+)